MAGPVHNSAVYVLNGPHHAPVIPPPSPPSPVTPSEAADLCTPIEELSLDEPVTPTTPVDFEDETTPVSQADDRLASAVHVLTTEATSLQCLANLYSQDRTARDGFNKAVEAITRHRGELGKLVVIGVGKSGHIARKLVATFNSLAVQASFMHPTEALHGDLGQVDRRHDTLMLITYSGKTPELSLLMPHLDAGLPLIVLTSHTTPDSCELITKWRGPERTILVPAPIHEPEMVSFGVNAPTTSTTAALAVGDALALACARELSPCLAAVFAKNHPGGAIGAAFAKGKAARATVKDLMVPLGDICILGRPSSSSRQQPLLGGELLRAAYDSATGWLRLDDGAVVPPSRIRRMGAAELAWPVDDMPWLGVPRSGQIALSAGTLLQDVRSWIRGMMAQHLDAGEDGCSPESVLAVLERGEVVGVLEARTVLESKA